MVQSRSHPIARHLYGNQCNGTRFCQWDGMRFDRLARMGPVFKILGWDGMSWNIRGWHLFVYVPNTDFCSSKKTFTKPSSIISSRWSSPELRLLVTFSKTSCSSVLGWDGVGRVSLKGRLLRQGRREIRTRVSDVWPWDKNFWCLGRPGWDEQDRKQFLNSGIRWHIKNMEWEVGWRGGQNLLTKTAPE